MKKEQKRKVEKRILLALICLGSLGAVGCGGKDKLLDISQSLIDNNVRIEQEKIATEIDSTQEQMPTEFEGDYVEVPEVETETETEEEPIRVTISAVGDCAFGPVQTHGYAGSFYEYYDTYGEAYFFQGVQDVFGEDDFTLVNLECVLTNETAKVEKQWNIKGYPEYVGILPASSIEGCSLGNNHTFDYGTKSHEDTEAVLNQENITYGFRDHYGVYETTSGVRIGVISASLLEGASQEVYFEDGIQALREDGVELIICCCHWGSEYEYYPSDYQQNLAHRLIDLGADLIIGNHPHVLEGIEYYNGKLICYSLGNFCFGANSNPKDKNTVIFQQTFTFMEGQLLDDLSARIVPCRLSSQKGYNDYQPTILDGEAGQEIIDKMNTYSQNYSAISFDEKGILHNAE